MSTLLRQQQKEAADALMAATTEEQVKAILKKYNGIKLSPLPLGLAFEKLYVDQTGWSKDVLISTLELLHPSFRTSNGGDWCRTSTSYIGSKYNIRRIKEGGRISTVRTEGFHKTQKIQNAINPTILKSITAQRCVILDISTNIECDHKDGMKDDWRVGDKNKQKPSDFQPLCKTANDAKRAHCAKCKQTHKRYDAKRLGYSVSYLKGDAETITCEGCYWYDPVEFNKEVSKNYK